MTSLIFQTPSKRCPFRSFNGREVRVTDVLGSHRVKRLGWRRTPFYRVEIPVFPYWQWIAIADELFVEPVAA